MTHPATHATKADKKFHETWLGLVQPIEGLVFSVPVLVDAQCVERKPGAFQARFRELCPEQKGQTAERAIAHLDEFLAEIFGLTPDDFDRGAAIPEDLCLWVEEGRTVLRPTLALRKSKVSPDADDEAGTPASRAGRAYELLVMELPAEVPLDKPDARENEWSYPPTAKLDRLLRACRVPIGILTNRSVVRLVYAPIGEISGAINFRIDDMASSSGRPILEAFAALLHRARIFSVAANRRLPALLAESRRRESDVTEALGDQVYEAFELLVAGFETAAERDDSGLLDQVLESDPKLLPDGLLTVLLRLVFLFYAEERGLLPVEHGFYARHLSVLALYEKLQIDAGAFPESMNQRYGAWGRILALFRAVYAGAHHHAMLMPPRHGDLFDPNRFAFLEGREEGSSAPIVGAADRAAIRVPSIDDDTIYRVLDKLARLNGTRLAYSALTVEQIGSVYEGMMGYRVLRAPSNGVRVRGKDDRLWLFGEELLEIEPGRRMAALEEQTSLSKSQLTKLGDGLKKARTADAVLEALSPLYGRKPERVPPGTLVIQPGSERQRSSAHYTPRSLSEPIVEKTLEPLFLTMGKEPSSDRILNLKICDPAMGSGAFLVAACRLLAERLVSAWSREGKLEAIIQESGDAWLEARRRVAQRCLYGVDRNPAAVGLAKLSIWIETLAKHEPFTFLDHALRHGDSLVGLSLEQIRGFHWAPETQKDIFRDLVTADLDDALRERERILALASNRGARAHQEREKLLRAADDAIAPWRLVGDLIIGAYFSAEKDKDRAKELERRLQLVQAWWARERKEGIGTPPDELLRLQAEMRGVSPPFHWHIEFPSVFHARRPDPLNEDQTASAAWMDALVGNPPFLGQSRLSGELGPAYRDWLFQQHRGAQGKSDLIAHFFRRANYLLGQHGSFGLIATNTISQGDTRESGLKFLLGDGCRIFHGIRSMTWPGQANVAVAVVHCAKGRVAHMPGLGCNSMVQLVARLIRG